MMEALRAFLGEAGLCAPNTMAMPDLKFLFRSLALVLALSGAVSPAFAYYSDSEGVLAPGHDNSLAKLKQRYFLDEQGQLDLEKLGTLKTFLTSLGEQLAASAKLSKKVPLIELRFAENDEAERKGNAAIGEKAEVLAPIHFALEYVEDLLKNSGSYSATQLQQRVDTAALFVSSAQTIYPETILTSAIERSKALYRNLFTFKVEDHQELQASNLQQDERFLSQEELRILRSQGVDISRIDPPSSAFWTDNAVEEYDVDQEVYLNRHLFPPVENEVPEFQFERMGSGQIKLKTHWLDSAELNKKGKPKKKDVTLRVGWEANTAPVVNHLARIIGYPAIPSTFRHKVKLQLGETSFEQFLVAWRRIHSNEQGSPLTHIERIPGENALFLKNVTLEAYPEEDEYRKMGVFRMGDNGLPNRREYRAMVLYNSLISLQDHAEYQARTDAYLDRATGLWRPLYFIADSSSALGLPAFFGYRGTVNEYTWEFTARTESKIRLFWLSVFDSRTWEQTTYSDVKWLARRIARISTHQLERIMSISGFPAPVKTLYLEKLKTRINKMIEDFDLPAEGFKQHPTRTKEEIAGQYPNYVDRDGYLKETAQEFEGNTAPVLGEKFTPYQAVVALSLNLFRNKLLSMAGGAISVDATPLDLELGHTEATSGLLFDASRNVQVNPEIGPHQKRYLLTDKLSVSIPIGINNASLTTPIALYYTFSFEYRHSVTSAVEAGTSRFFAALNPFDLTHIKKNLREGEQLSVSHAFGASVGNLKVVAAKALRFQASLLGLSDTYIKQLYFSKPSKDLLEITVSRNQDFVHQSGIDISTYLKFGVMFSNRSSRSDYSLYRIDTLNASGEQGAAYRAAFSNALIDNDFAPLDALVAPLRTASDTQGSEFSLNFFIWSFGNEDHVSLLNFDGKESILAHAASSSGRDMEPLWKLKPLEEAELIGYVFNPFWAEGSSATFTLQAEPDSDWLDFEQMDLKIAIRNADGSCSRREFDRDFKPFFNSRAGQNPYIQWEMPEGLDRYLNIEGFMKWQLNAKAVRALLRNAMHTGNLPRVIDTPRNPNPGAWIKQRRLLRAAQEALVPLPRSMPLEDRRSALKERAQLIVEALKYLLGDQAQRVGLIRRYVDDQDLWLTTGLRKVLDVSNPTFWAQKDQLYYAPEVGKFQGQTRLDLFRRDHALKPILAAD